MYLKVNIEKCTGCQECLNTCPYDAIEMRDENAFINEYCQLCRMCLEACPEGAISEIKEEGDLPSAIPSPESTYEGIWIFAEQREGMPAPVAYELLGAGRKLADTLKADLSAVILGVEEGPAQELFKWGADRVYLCNDPSLAKFNDEVYAGILARLISEQRPAIVLAGATPVGRSFIPRVAARVHTGLTADCTSLEIDEDTGNLLQIRPAFGGNIMASIVCPHHRPQMATVRPRVMKRGKYDPDKTGDIVQVASDSITSRTRVVESVKEISDVMVNLHEAEYIVAGGRGVGGAEGFKLIEELAAVLGGAVGASRAAVDEEWMPYSHQIGQTGKTVCPKIYIACGISGAVQHLVGMQSSDIIIAINKNPEAPIFNVATFGIVGDLFEILPLLLKKIKEMKGL